jgi:dTDP-4-amino-4,6-dideoxygalactose transaminase
MFSNFINKIKFNYYFGFISGHGYLSKIELKKIADEVGKNSQDHVELFEKRFAALIGEGAAISFASARMGFFALMQHYKIVAGDEVILPGSTCSVMVNAVLRLGAIPIYADIDSNTFGSSAKEICKVITPKTRLIVAQHSFGIPCDIFQISSLAKRLNIPLIEDCALTLGSTVNNIVCGDFGDAAIFSTDHSKPLNTIIGGLVYSRNKSLIASIHKIQNGSQNLSFKKQKDIWRQFLFERIYCDPSKYGLFWLINLIRSIVNIKSDPFLSQDFGRGLKSSYPYPARLPSFLAMIGNLEISKWKESVANRYIFLEKLKDLISKDPNIILPSAYRDNNLSIIPLRFVFTSVNVNAYESYLSKFIDISWTWFRKPIIGYQGSLDDLYYRVGQCPISEQIGQKIINIPCNISEKNSLILLNLIEKSLKKSTI